MVIRGIPAHSEGILTVHASWKTARGARAALTAPLLCALAPRRAGCVPHSAETGRPEGPGRVPCKNCTPWLRGFLIVLAPLYRLS